MSRSYKKNPIYKYAPSSKRKGAKKAKRMANKKVRRVFCIDGKYYRRLTNPWDIHDIVSRWTWEECVEQHYRLMTIREVNLDWNNWAKYFLRK